MKEIDALAVGAGGSDALFQQLTTAHVVAIHALAEQVAAAEDALAVVAAELRAVLQQLHAARLVLRHAFALVAAS